MGLNTIHQKSDDVIECFDITQGFYFRCQLLGNKDSRALEMAKGLEVNVITFTIQVNGKCNLKDKDKIRIMGSIKQVITMSSNFDNPELFRKRADYDSFTGATQIGLQ